MRFFQIFTTHFHLLAPPLNKEFFIKSPPPPLYWQPFPTTLLCVIGGGGSNCKCWGKKPQVHLIIIKEWPKNTLILRNLDNFSPGAYQNNFLHPFFHHHLFLPLLSLGLTHLALLKNKQCFFNNHPYVCHLSIHFVSHWQ